MNHVIPNHHTCSVTLLGNLVAAPEIRYLANPVLAVTEIILATTHKWQDKKSREFKEWTSFHHVKVIGELVERCLTFARKGELFLIQGYIANDKSGNDIIHATSIERFAKGYSQSINRVIISGQLCSPIKFMTTEQNRPFAHFDINIEHFARSEQSKSMIAHQVKRQVNLWGKAADYLNQRASKEQILIIEGRLAYANDSEKSQYIEASSCHLVESAV